ncbi:MAG: hypothetical protein AAFN91_17615 [Pseudomonadota bacterium]
MPTILVFDGFRSEQSDAKIKEITRRLNDRLDQELDNLEPSIVYQHRDMRAAVKLWDETDPWSAKARNTQINYQDKVSPLLMWSEAAGHPPLHQITRSAARALINNMRDRPFQAHGVLWAAKKIMSYAVQEGWIQKDPFQGIRVSLPKAQISLWSQHDVDLYVEAAHSLELPSIARLIRIEWELGQRISDVARFRRGKEYDQTKGCFRFWQQKTQTYLELPARSELQHDLAGDSQLFLIIDELTGGPFKGRDEWGRSFDKVRAHATGELEGRHLQLRQLRHSVVVDMARNECTIAEIAAVTGHTIARTTAILDVYLPRDSAVARNALSKRWNTK